MTKLSSKIIKLLEYKKNNAIAQRTARLFRSRKTKVIYFNEIYKSSINTRQRKKFYTALGYTEHYPKLIALNEEKLLNRDELMIETFIHEFNHILNPPFKVKTSGEREILAYIAQFCYKRNYGIVTRSLLRYVKHHILSCGCYKTVTKKKLDDVDYAKGFIY